MLEKELAFYESKRNELLAHYENKFVLIKGNELIDFFTSMQEAYNEGVKRFGTEPFLVKRVSREEPIEKLPALTLGIINARL